MRRIRSIAAQSPAIVISMLAVVLTLGGGALASTHHNHLVAGPSQGPVHTLKVAGSHAVAHSGAKVSWHGLVLQNGWISANGLFASGNPRVALQNGIVYLSGSLLQSTGTSQVFAFLPSTYRPSHNMWITVYTYGGTSGTLYIGKDGSMQAFSEAKCGSGPASAAQCFTSLATVSYPINS